MMPSAPPKRPSLRELCPAAAWRYCDALGQCQKKRQKARVMRKPVFRFSSVRLTRQIAENSAADGGVVVARMVAGTGNEGFDAGRKQYVDLIEAGIIDPTKVVRVALENAVSVASVLLLTEATMTEISEEKSERATEPDMSL